jgi:CDP-6-deoxy-D-xylo-4-hexulose-3-dehydrase
MSAAVGIEQLKKLPSIINMRRANAKFFQKIFSNVEGIQIQQEIGNSSWFGFSLIIESSTMRNKLVSEFIKNGVECRPIAAGNFTRQDVIRYFNYEVYGKLVNSDIIHYDGLFIGNHHYDICDKLKKVANIVFHVLEQSKKTQETII